MSINSGSQGLLRPGLEAMAEGGEVGTGLRRSEFLRQMFWGARLAKIGTVTIVLVLLFCFLGPHLYHTDQIHPNDLIITKGPNSHHWLGTDGNGFDEVGQLMIGGQSALEIGLASAFLASVFGTLYGAAAGYLGGFWDALLMRIVDTMLAIPGLLLLLLLTVIFTSSVPVLIVILALFAWLGPARLVRGETLTLRTREYVQAAKLMGSGGTRIVLRHIVPNALGTIVVNTTFQVADGILALASLSFLGLGPPPPAVNWGGILSDGSDYLNAGAWWLVYPAGVILVVTVVAFNFLGEGIEEALGARAGT
ncbi:MAG: ABC transporter permease [Actinomycetota bacterium]